MLTRQQASENRDRYSDNEVSSIQRVPDAPVSTCGVDVDTGSYANVGRRLTDGQVPPQTLAADARVRGRSARRRAGQFGRRPYVLKLRYKLPDEDGSRLVEATTPAREFVRPQPPSADFA